MVRVFSVGDAQLDVFLELSEADTHQRHGVKELCLVFADKLPVSSVHFSVAGNACNAAVCFARLGLESYFLTIHGDDRTGQEIEEKLKIEGVKRDYIKTQAGTPSSYSAVLNFRGERTQLVYYHPRDYRLPENIKDFDWLYVSQVGKKFGPIFEDVVGYVRKRQARLIFNPTNDQLNSDYESYKAMVENSQVLSVNKEEGEKLLSSRLRKSYGGQAKFKVQSSKLSYNMTEIKDLLERIRGLGAKIVVVTDGERGSYCFDGESFYHLPIFKVAVVEKTGAGDAYTAAFAAALIRGKDVKEAMRWGTFNAGSVVQKYGPQEGLLRKEELEGLLGENPKLVALHF